MANGISNLFRSLTTGGANGASVATARERLSALLNSLPEKGYYARIHGPHKVIQVAPQEAARYVARGEQVEIFKDGGPPTVRGGWLPVNTRGTPPGDELVARFTGNYFFHASDVQLDEVARQLSDHLQSGAK